MKRRLAFLALPLVLVALVFGVKWRADHPAPTKEDLEIRALMRQAERVEVYYMPRMIRLRKVADFSILIPLDESVPLIDSFWLSNPPRLKALPATGANGELDVYWMLGKQRGDGVNGGFINIDISKRVGVFHFGDPNHIIQREIHPVTVRRFLDFLLADRRIGPEIRKRLNQ